MKPNTTPLTREAILKIHEMSEAVNKQVDFASELLRTAQDRFGTTTETFEREGKEITVERNVLWQEVFYLGHNCQAAEILKKSHQDVFDAYQHQAKLAEDMKHYCITVLGVDYTKMTLSDYIRVTEEVIKLNMAEAAAK